MEEMEEMQNQMPQEETPQEPLKGKAAFLASLKDEEPDYEPADDDELFERANGMRGELGKHKESSSKLAGIIAKDPRMGAVLSMVADGKSYPYAHAKVFGKEAMELEGDELEEWETGYQENLEQMGASKAAIEESNKNIQQYKDDLATYCEGRSEEEMLALNDKIYEIADNMLNGIIPMDIIELIDNGLNHDQNVQDAADTAAAEGRNTKIDMKKRKMDMPDMGESTKSKGRPMAAPKQGSFYENLEKSQL